MRLLLRRAWFTVRLWPSGRWLGYGLRDHWRMSRDAYLAPNEPVPGALYAVLRALALAGETMRRGRP